MPKDKKAPSKPKETKESRPLERSDAMSRKFFEEEAPKIAKFNRELRAKQREKEGQASATSGIFKQELKDLGAKSPAESHKETKSAEAAAASSGNETEPHENTDRNEGPRKI